MGGLLLSILIMGLLLPLISLIRYAVEPTAKSVSDVWLYKPDANATPFQYRFFKKTKQSGHALIVNGLPLPKLSFQASPVLLLENNGLVLRNGITNNDKLVPLVKNEGFVKKVKELFQTIPRARMLEFSGGVVELYLFGDGNSPSAKQRIEAEEVLFSKWVDTFDELIKASPVTLASAEDVRIQQDLLTKGYLGAFPTFLLLVIVAGLSHFLASHFIARLAVLGTAALCVGLNNYQINRDVSDVSARPALKSGMFFLTMLFTAIALLIA